MKRSELAVGMYIAIRAEGTRGRRADYRRRPARGVVVDLNPPDGKRTYFPYTISHKAHIQARCERRFTSDDVLFPEKQWTSQFIPLADVLGPWDPVYKQWQEDEAARAQSAKNYAAETKRRNDEVQPHLDRFKRLNVDMESSSYTNDARMDEFRINRENVIRLGRIFFAIEEAAASEQAGNDGLRELFREIAKATEKK